MKKSFTLLNVLLALLLGNNVVWGQHGVLLPEYQNEQATPRRENNPGSIDHIGAWFHPTEQPYGTTVGFGNVNNEFGAGESSWVSGNALKFPVVNSLKNPPVLRLGSTDSKNIVINTYNAGGYASGWLDIRVWTTICSDPATFYPSESKAVIAEDGLLVIVPSALDNQITSGLDGMHNVTAGQTITLANGYKGIGANQLVTASLSSQGGDLSALDGVLGYATMETINKVTLYMAQHAGTASGTTGIYTYNKAMYQTPYTSTGEYKGHTPAPNNFPALQDDGIWLFQYAGSKLINSTGIAVGTAPTPTGVNAYKRPTTVVLEGNNSFNQITFSDLRWYYQRNEILPFPSGHPAAGMYYSTVDQSGRHGWDCCHYVGNSITSAEQTAGYEMIKINVTSIPDFTSYTPQIGDTYLDAAVQLLEGARVCVQGNVLDNTTVTPSGTSSGGTTTTTTNAIITLPVADRVTFRTAGNFKVNMYHERDSDMTRAAYYSASGFPDPATDIFLYSGSSIENFGRSMKSFTNTQYTTVTTQAPYTQSSSSIFGVNGNYLHAGNMAEIHTDSTSYDNSNPGVIEVGTTTAGKSHFHVYGNGMLKNFEGCTTLANFPMYFGNTKGGTPVLQINTNDTLYLVNFGSNGSNYCDADLLFHTTSVDSLNLAFSGTGGGALQIQSLSDLRLRGNGAWDVTTNGNNIYLLSDGGNISTQKLDLLSDNVGGVGHGLVTLWAETDPLTDGCAGNSGTNRFSKSGNIYMNDAVTLVRAASNTTQTNIIAANNIRTASFSSSNHNDQDTTNIISRMGDIYLGYSAGTPIYSASDAYPTSNGLTGDDNVFSYTGTGSSGILNIKAGYDDQNNPAQYGGGNIYFTHIDANMDNGKDHQTNITIPFSNEYQCSTDGALHLRAGATMQKYEHAGIIGGVGRCGIDHAYASYAGELEEGIGLAAALNNINDTSLIYRANNGRLLVDAGTRGNIIMNRGTFLDFQNDNGNGFFLTRNGDIDLRYRTDVQNLMGSVLFLANSELPNKLNVEACGCDEQRNNVYLQDFKFDINGGVGSIFIGADNNIKLQYGGLRNIGTQRDPFLSEDTDYPCGSGKYHCDSDTAANQARDLILDFNDAATSGNGGFGVVASDLIDVYKNLIYKGGSSGTGMSSVPQYGSLHGEAVAGYGLYIKTQANKKNWDKSDHDINSDPDPFVGAACESDICQGDAFLHKTARVTFHADAQLYAENQKVYISSPVLETFGYANYNTQLNKGSKTSILIKADSLIYHDSLIIDGPGTEFSTWSGLYRDMPVIRLGHQRFTPPTSEGTDCKDCHIHRKGSGGLDTVFVTFRNDASVSRLHTLVAEHAVISFLTDSFDNQRGNPTLNAKFYTDTFKIRNHVELFKYADHTRDGHFELISEQQMESKNYAGIYSRHLHMEPIAPSCSDFGYSQLWLQDPTLDVITSSTLGGFGWLHADVHVEKQANLFPGYASLRQDGNCYELKAGVLKMEDLRIDEGANLTFSVGDNASSFAEIYDCPSTSERIELGRYADCLDVDLLTIYGSVYLDLLIRPEGLLLGENGSRCFPVIRYNSVGDDVLNHLKLKKNRLTSQDHPTIDGIYYLTLDVDTECKIVYICIATQPDPVLQREISIPLVPGITTNPQAGDYYVRSGSGFSFTAKYGPEFSEEGKQLAVRTGRVIDGVEEIIIGIRNANGEYEYSIQGIRTNIKLTFGPDYVSSDEVESSLVWSHDNMIYIRVDKKEIASIYLITGKMVKRIQLTEGTTSVPMEYGMYIVTLNDGSVHKVIVK